MQVDQDGILRAEKWYTRKEAADLLSMKESTLKRWGTIGRGPAFIKTGDAKYSDVRYPASCIIAYQQRFKPANREDHAEDIHDYSKAS